MGSRRRRRRGAGGMFGIVRDLADDVKDFVDDEVIDRGRNSERDLRRAGRNWYDDDDPADRRERPPRPERSRRSEDLDELREAISSLGRHIEGLHRNRSERPAAAPSAGTTDAAEPWPGYDQQTVSDIRKTLMMAADDETIRRVAEYERRHKARKGVLDAAGS